MAWVKLDDKFFSHRKVVDLSPSAKLLYIAGLTYCATALTDGHLPPGAVRLAAALADVDVSAATELVTAGLWEQDRHGYQIHDYLAYQPSREQVENRRAQSVTRVKRHRNAACNGVTNGGCNATPDPDPDPSPNPDPNPIPDPLPIGGSAEGGTASAAPSPRPTRRAPADFTLTPELAEFGIARGLGRDEIREEFDALKDYEFRTPHKDWVATARNWLRRAARDRCRSGRPSGTPSPKTRDALEQLKRTRERLKEQGIVD